MIPLDEVELRELISEVFQQQLEKRFNSKPENDEVLLTAKEVQKFLNVSAPTLNELRKSGVIPSYRLGTSIRFKKSEVMDAFNNCRIKLLKK